MITDTATRGRLLVLLAALGWSTSGFFTKILTKPTPLGLHEPPVDGLQIAFYRVLFAGLVLLPLVRPRDVTFRPAMALMAVCFTFMNATFILAMSAGTAANAILLQYTAPMWVFLASVSLLGEKVDRNSLAVLLVGLLGILVIVGGGWRESQLGVVGLGLASGFGYAAVILFLRVLRGASSQWLTVLNHLVGGLALLPLVWYLPRPTWGQLGLLVIYGGLQMGVPYLLMARGLHSISAQEAGTITLLEPLLNPLWAYLIAGEAPSPTTLVGGGLILAALVWRYWPVRRKPNGEPGG